MFLKIVLDSGFENFENTILELFENSSCFLNSIYIYIYIFVFFVLLEHKKLEIKHVLLILLVFKINFGFQSWNFGFLLNHGITCIL